LVKPEISGKLRDILEVPCALGVTYQKKKIPIGNLNGEKLRHCKMEMVKYRCCRRWSRFTINGAKDYRIGTASQWSHSHQLCINSIIHQIKGLWFSYDSEMAEKSGRHLELISGLFFCSFFLK